MNKIEALKLELAARELVEGTGLEWTDVIKECGKPLLHHHLVAPRDQYEIALRVLEGKPVWEGDTLYTEDNTTAVVATKASITNFKTFGYELSWNPPKPKPKPKTVMVELSMEDTAFYARLYGDSGIYLRVAEACRKALENLK